MSKIVLHDVSPTEVAEIIATLGHKVACCPSVGDASSPVTIHTRHKYVAARTLARDHAKNETKVNKDAHRSQQIGQAADWRHSVPDGVGGSGVLVEGWWDEDRWCATVTAEGIDEGDLRRRVAVLSAARAATEREASRAAVQASRAAVEARFDGARQAAASLMGDVTMDVVMIGGDLAHVHGCTRSGRRVSVVAERGPDSRWSARWPRDGERIYV